MEIMTRKIAFKNNFLKLKKGAEIVDIVLKSHWKENTFSKEKHAFRWILRSSTGKKKPFPPCGNTG
jgi:hypothetical protein